MTRYLVLYRAPTSAREQMAQATPEQAKAGMELWGHWAQKADGAIVDMGAPLGEGRRLEAGAARPGDATITGFSILQAASMDDALALLKDHPHFHTPSGSIEVLETLQMTS
jgi:hypothetical protein